MLEPNNLHSWANYFHSRNQHFTALTKRISMIADMVEGQSEENDKRLDNPSPPVNGSLLSRFEGVGIVYENILSLLEGQIGRLEATIGTTRDMETANKLAVGSIKGGTMTVSKDAYRPGVDAFKDRSS